MKTDGLLFTRTHEWVKKLDENSYQIGITDHAQQELGDLVFVTLPQKGDKVKSGDDFSEIESVKAVSSIYSPFTGVISDVNAELADNPELINQAPYESWLIQVSEVSEQGELLTAAQYDKFLSEEN